MEKEGKKRSAGWSGDGDGKNARARPNDEEVEEFFALIRRIRSTAHLLDKEKARSPSFQWEDFVASFNNTAASEATAATSTGGKALGGGRRSPSDRSSKGRDEEAWEAEEEEEEDDDDEQEAKRESIEDNGLPGWLDLNVDLAAAKNSC